METQQYKSSKRRENRKTALKILICIFVTTMISVFGIVFLTSNLSFLVNWYEKMMPYVFIGRNSDGTARMLRVGKQFREVVGCSPGAYRREYHH